MPKRKTLPKDFEDTLKSGDLAAMQAVFDTCLLDATGGFMKHTALAFRDCPDDLTRWLVAQGADISAPDSYGKTPLHSRAATARGNLALLIELGADPNAGEGSLKGTPLHSAAMARQTDNMRTLLEHGAKVDALNGDGYTALTEGIRRATGPDFKRASEMTEMLISAGAVPQPQTGEFLTIVAKGFEFHRANFNPETVGEASAALDRLYELLGVEPVAKRVMHDGRSAIKLPDAPPATQFSQLWDSLVPSKGAAQTVQGEVIRIAGRIMREIDGNGRINWNKDFALMADAMAGHLASGQPLPDASLTNARGILADAKRGMTEVAPLRDHALNWVEANPDPVALPTPAYTR